MSLPPDIADYYDRGDEPERLTRGPEGQLELIRTQALLERLLPAPPAAIADVGGGAGIHAAPLAARGYEVHLVDPVAGHVAQASALGLASALVGDARELPFEDERFDAVLLLGPLYHLHERADRLAALAEARRAAPALVHDRLLPPARGGRGRALGRRADGRGGPGDRGPAWMVPGLGAQLEDRRAASAGAARARARRARPEPARRQRAPAGGRAPLAPR